MRRSRVLRSVAVLMTTLFAFQLWLTGSGMVCAMPGPAEQGMTRAMSGAMPMGSTAAAAERPAASSDAANMPRGNPQSLALCQLMGPCATALAPARIGADGADFGTSPRVIAMVVLAPPSQSFPPEPPPPRA